MMDGLFAVRRSAPVEDRLARIKLNAGCAAEAGRTWASAAHTPAQNVREVQHQVEQALIELMQRDDTLPRRETVVVANAVNCLARVRFILYRDVEGSRWQQGVLAPTIAILDQLARLDLHAPNVDQGVFSPIKVIRDIGAELNRLAHIQSTWASGPPPPAPQHPEVATLEPTISIKITGMRRAVMNLADAGRRWAHAAAGTMPKEEKERARRSVLTLIENGVMRKKPPTPDEPRVVEAMRTCLDDARLIVYRDAYTCRWQLDVLERTFALLDVFTDIDIYRLRDLANGSCFQRYDTIAAELARLKERQQRPIEHDPGSSSHMAVAAAAAESNSRREDGESSNHDEASAIVDSARAGAQAAAGSSGREEGESSIHDKAVTIMYSARLGAEAGKAWSGPGPRSEPVQRLRSLILFRHLVKGRQAETGGPGTADDTPVIAAMRDCLTRARRILYREVDRSSRNPSVLEPAIAILEVLSDDQLFARGDLDDRSYIEKLHVIRAELDALAMQQDRPGGDAADDVTPGARRRHEEAFGDSEEEEERPRPAPSGPRLYDLMRSLQLQSDGAARVAARAAELMESIQAYATLQREPSSSLEATLRSDLCFRLLAGMQRNVPPHEGELSDVRPETGRRAWTLRVRRLKAVTPADTLVCTLHIVAALLLHLARYKRLTRDLQMIESMEAIVRQVMVLDANETWFHESYPESARALFQEAEDLYLTTTCGPSQPLLRR